jgi:hypothetical protein
MYTTHGKDGKFTLNISKKAEENAWKIQRVWKNITTINLKKP